MKKLLLILLFFLPMLTFAQYRISVYVVPELPEYETLPYRSIVYDLETGCFYRVAEDYRTYVPIPEGECPTGFGGMIDSIFYFQYSDWVEDLSGWYGPRDTILVDTSLWDYQPNQAGDFSAADFSNDFLLFLQGLGIFNKSDQIVTITNDLYLEDTLHFGWSNSGNITAAIVHPDKRVDTATLVEKAWLLWCDTLIVDSIYLKDPPYAWKPHELKYDPVTELVYYYLNDEAVGGGTPDTFFIDYVCEPTWSGYWVFSGDTIRVDTCGDESQFLWYKDEDNLIHNVPSGGVYIDTALRLDNFKFMFMAYKDQMVLMWDSVSGYVHASPISQFIDSTAVDSSLWIRVNDHLEPKPPIDSVWVDIINTDTVYSANYHCSFELQYDLYKGDPVFDSAWYDIPSGNYYLSLEGGDYEIEIGDSVVLGYKQYSDGCLDFDTTYQPKARIINIENVDDKIQYTLSCVYCVHYECSFYVEGCETVEDQCVYFIAKIYTEFCPEIPVTINDSLLVVGNVRFMDSIYLNRYAVPHLKPNEPVGLPLVMRKLYPPLGFGQLAQTTWQTFYDTLTYNTTFYQDIAFEFRDIFAGTSQTYTLDISASFPYTVISAYLETDNGTLTGVDIKIGSTAITGLSSLTVDTAVDETQATANNNVVVGNRLYLITSTGYTGQPTLIRGKIKVER